MISLYLQSSPAQVAKLVDALPSGGSIRKDVMVRVHSWALTIIICLQKSSFVSKMRIFICPKVRKVFYWKTFLTFECVQHYCPQNTARFL